MSRPHTERIVSELSADARGVLDKLRQEELDAGGFLRDAEVKLVFGYILPRVERIVGDLVGCAVDRYGSMTLNDALELLNGLKSEHNADG